jgi:hypothetical protein
MVPGRQNGMAKRETRDEAIKRADALSGELSLLQVALHDSWVAKPDAIESAVYGDERWDFSVFRVNGAAGGILVEVFHDECGGTSVAAHYWEKYQEAARVATTYIGSEAAHAVSDAVYRLKNKLQAAKETYRLHSVEDTGVWTSEPFSANERRDIVKAVIAGFLSGHPRWATSPDGAFIYGLDAKGNEIKAPPVVKNLE